MSNPMNHKDKEETPFAIESDRRLSVYPLLLFIFGRLRDDRYHKLCCYFHQSAVRSTPISENPMVFMYAS